MFRLDAALTVWRLDRSSRKAEALRRDNNNWPEIPPLPLEILAGNSYLVFRSGSAPVVWRAACFDLFALIWQADWSA
ncbi:MAG: hypothetical protein VB138_11845 [Burkholderia sp.]